MLKKENRLTSKRIFSATYYNNNSSANDLIVLYTGKPKNLNNEEYRPTRVGFVVSKKVHKRAVRRNRVKRVMRESVRLIFKSDDSELLNKFQSHIFIAKKDFSDLNQSKIQDIILTLLKKQANKNI